MKRLLQVCFLAAMFFGLASCSKDDNNSSNNGGGGASSNLASLAGTSWVSATPDRTVVLEFRDATNVGIMVIDDHGESPYYGSYTYGNGSGTINFVMDGESFNIPFTVSGSTLTAHNTPDGDVVFTLENGYQPQPGPNPGGDLRNSLVGTGWMYMNDEVIVAVEFGPNAMVGVVVSPVNGGDDMEYCGSYTYNNFNGTISINVEGQDYTIHFVVNGETMVASDTPIGYITLTRMNK